MPARILRTAFLAFSFISIAVFGAIFALTLAAGELFHRLGFDWSLFYAQAVALREGAGPRMYDTAEVNRYLQPLMGFYGGPAEALTGWPQPYPPWSAAAMVPFTLLSPPLDFAAWLALSIVAGLFLAYRVRQFLPRLGWLGAVAAVFAAVPVSWALFMGQPTVLLGVAVSEMFVSFKAKQDLRAGLWLSLLLLKPQYAVLFGIFILWQRRWHALAGAAIGGLVLVGLGILTGGLQSLLRYPAVLADIGDLHNEIAGPLLMMNWRAIVLAVRPGIGEQVGLVIVWTLSLLTMLAALLVWRGKWDPDSPEFDLRFGLLSIGALVGSYHSHLHGAALLAVPIAAAWSSSLLHPATRVVLWLAVYAPTFFVLWITGLQGHLSVSSDPNTPLWTVWPNVLPAALYVGALALLSVNALRVRLPRIGLSPARGYA
jgi:hypothetical protein